MVGGKPWSGLLLVVLLLSATRTDAADDLEKQLLKHVPQVMSALREAGYKNVGVLKFRVKKGEEPASDRVGTLNQRLAEKLEMALIVANDVRNPIGVVSNANQVAAKISGATHLTTEGRKLLFSREYPLAWGDEQVVPDAFLTGVAFISADLRNMTVGIFSFDQSGEDLKPLAKFEMRPDLEDLLESGESFTVRGVFDSGSLELSTEERKDKATEEALQTSLKAKSETADKTVSFPAAKDHPLSKEHADSPISLEIRYDNKVQPIEFRDGAAFIPEPQEGQKVFLVVRRKGSGKDRLGLVLKVNGENTLERQKLADAQAKVWVLEPDRDVWGFQGFYDPAASSMQPFTVLSQAESKEKEIDYGEFVGTISVSVFPEQKVKPKETTELLTDEGEDFQILAEATFPEKKADNLSALKQQLAQSTTRGLIAQGKSVEQQLDTTTFQKDAVPIMTATVKYYSPHDLPE